MPLIVGVADGVTGPWASFARKLAGGGVGEFRRADTVRHVGQLIFGVVGERQRGTDRVCNACQIADGVVTVGRVSLLDAPTIGQPVISIVPIL